VTDTLQKYVLVFLGGGLGAAARYGVAGIVQRLTGPVFPFGTLAVNVLGSFLIGLVLGLSERHMSLSPAFRTFFAVGVLGGFTTFSTFSYETMSLVQDGEIISAVANITGTVLCCLGGVWAGGLLGRLV